MWIVRLALRRPFTVAAFCLVVLLLGALSAASMPVDIFPSIDIPVVVVVWNYPGLSAEDMERRITFISERAHLHVGRAGSRRIDSQSIDGTGRRCASTSSRARDIGSAIAQIIAVVAAATRVMPPGIQPPVVLQLQRVERDRRADRRSRGRRPSKSSTTGACNFLRIRLFTIPGLSTPAPYGGKQREVMVDVDPARAQAHGVSPQDVVNALLAQNVILPAGSARIGDDRLRRPRQRQPQRRRRVQPVAREGRQRRDGLSRRRRAASTTATRRKTNVVRVDGRRASYLAILKKAERVDAGGRRHRARDAPQLARDRPARRGAEARVRSVDASSARR